MTLRVFVGNLPFACTTDDLKALFAPHGDVLHASIVLEGGTGRSKGCGFVEFDDTATMLAAISAMDGQTCNGRRLTVREAREEPAAGPGSSPQSDAKAGAKDRPHAKHPHAPGASANQGRRDKDRRHGSGDPAQHKRRDQGRGPGGGARSNPSR